MDDYLDFDQVEELMDRQQGNSGGNGGVNNDDIITRRDHHNRTGSSSSDVVIENRGESSWNNNRQDGNTIEGVRGGYRNEGPRPSSYYYSNNNQVGPSREHYNNDNMIRYHSKRDTSLSSSRNSRHYNDDKDGDEVKRRRTRTRRSSPSPSSAAGDAVTPNTQQQHHHRYQQQQSSSNDERTRMVQQAHRDDCTVMVMGIHPKCTEREVYVFMSQNAGKVRDVQVIRDPRTNRSKGVAYVEFYTPETILKALACNGQPLMGHPIRIQASQAEKNRAAEAARVVQNQQQDLPMRVYIGNLQGPLIHLQESEIRKLFSPFGDIQSIEIAKSPYTGKPRGFAFVIYSRACDARVAIAAMHEYIIADIKLQVGYLASAVNTALLSQMESLNNNNNNNQ